MQRDGFMPVNTYIQSGSTGTGFTSNFNVVVNLFSPDDGGTFQTLAQWQTATGQDKNSIISTPAAVFINVAANITGSSF